MLNLLLQSYRFAPYMPVSYHLEFIKIVKDIERLDFIRMKWLDELRKRPSRGAAAGCSHIKELPL